MVKAFWFNTTNKHEKTNNESSHVMLVGTHDMETKESKPSCKQILSNLEVGLSIPRSLEDVVG